MNLGLEQIVRLPLAALDAIADSLRWTRREVEHVVLRPLAGSEPVRLVEWTLVTLRAGVEEPVLARGQKLVSGCLTDREIDNLILLEVAPEHTVGHDTDDLRNDDAARGSCGERSAPVSDRNGQLPDIPRRLGRRGGAKTERRDRQ